MPKQPTPDPATEYTSGWLRKWSESQREIVRLKAQVAELNKSQIHCHCDADIIANLTRDLEHARQIVGGLTLGLAHIRGAADSAMAGHEVVTHWWYRHEVDRILARLDAAVPAAGEEGAG